MAHITQAHLTSRTLTESIVAVPAECLERCSGLRPLIGEAAVAQLGGSVCAIVCDSGSQRYNFPRSCPAVMSTVRLADSVAVSPAIVGEGEVRAFVDRVDEAIEKHGARNLVQASKLVP